MVLLLQKSLLPCPCTKHQSHGDSVEPQKTFYHLICRKNWKIQVKMHLRYLQLGLIGLMAFQALLCWEQVHFSLIIYKDSPLWRDKEFWLSFWFADTLKIRADTLLESYIPCLHSPFPCRLMQIGKATSQVRFWPHVSCFMQGSNSSPLTPAWPLSYVKADVLQWLGNSWQLAKSVCWLGEAARSKLKLSLD